MRTIFQKEYSDESLYDLDRDISEALSDPDNVMADIPVDDDGFREGTFIVTINWVR